VAGETLRDDLPGTRMFDDAADLFRAVAHPVRARILHLLCRRDATAAELCESTGAEARQLSRHLNQMRAQDLIQRLPSGDGNIYRLAYPEGAGLLAAASSLLHTRAGAAATTAGRTNNSVRPDVPPPPGSGSSSSPEVPVNAVFSDEQFAALEATLASRSLIGDACESIAARAGCSLDAAARQLMTIARERQLTLREAAGEELRNREERRQL
jgi:DNA-binding transcriptional ArsR family regulator